MTTNYFRIYASTKGGCNLYQISDIDIHLGNFPSIGEAQSHGTKLGLTELPSYMKDAMDNPSPTQKLLKRFNNGLKNYADVSDFQRSLFVELRLSYHPDDDFNDVVMMADNSRTFSLAEAERLNELNQQAHKICQKQNKDVYSLPLIMQNYLLKKASRL